MKHIFSLAALGLAGLSLSACSALQSNSAMELIQHQQEQQAMERSAELKEARKNQPTRADMQLNLVREARRDQRYFAVVAYARQYIAQHGHTPELDALYAEGLMETGQEAQSQALYQALVHTAFAAQAYHGLGLLAARAHQNAVAVQDLTQAVSLQPANPVYLSDLGYAQLLVGDLKGAGLSLGQAAELVPDDAKTLGNMAVLLLLRDQSTDADALMRKADFSDSTRERVYALAAQLRSGGTVSAPPRRTSAVPAQVAAVPAASNVSAAGTPQDPVRGLAAPVPEPVRQVSSREPSAPTSFLHQRLVQ